MNDQMGSRSIREEEEEEEEEEEVVVVVVVVVGVCTHVFMHGCSLQPVACIVHIAYI